MGALGSSFFILAGVFTLTQFFGRQNEDTVGTNGAEDQMVKGEEGLRVGVGVDEQGGDLVNGVHAIGTRVDGHERDVAEVVDVVVE